MQSCIIIPAQYDILIIQVNVNCDTNYRGVMMVAQLVSVEIDHPLIAQEVWDGSNIGRNKRGLALAISTHSFVIIIHTSQLL